MKPKTTRKLTFSDLYQPKLIDIQQKPLKFTVLKAFVMHQSILVVNKSPRIGKPWCEQVSDSFCLYNF